MWIARVFMLSRVGQMMCSALELGADQQNVKWFVFGLCLRELFLRGIAAVG
jgi:hypothetical protein